MKKDRLTKRDTLSGLQSRHLRLEDHGLRLKVVQLLLADE
jgi:hypothetical protein